jgi:hypothetical protein
MPLKQRLFVNCSDPVLILVDPLDTYLEDIIEWMISKQIDEPKILYGYITLIPSPITDEDISGQYGEFNDDQIKADIEKMSGKPCRIRKREKLLAKVQELSQTYQEEIPIVGLSLVSQVDPNVADTLRRNPNLQQPAGLTIRFDQPQSPPAGYEPDPDQVPAGW